jgi:hypothetical protein
LEISNCCMVPAEPPQPMVKCGAPYASMKCSLTIIAVSAEVTSLQLLAKTLKVALATA